MNSGLHEALSPEREHILADIAGSPGVVLLLGGSDTGKTTWGRHAARWLSRQGCFPLALVDADIGQASLGPPAAVALSLLHHVFDEGDVTAERFRYDALSFVGSVSPMGHALQMITATKRLVDRAHRAGATTVLVEFKAGLNRAGRSHHHGISASGARSRDDGKRQS
jgi:polynucleotide 5'-hydroxyl-kinase GRC3/NOL9